MAELALIVFVGWPTTVAAYNKVEDVPGQGTLAVLTVARGLGQHACRISF